MIVRTQSNDTGGWQQDEIVSHLFISELTGLVLTENFYPRLIDLSHRSLLPIMSLFSGDGSDELETCIGLPIVLYLAATNVS